MNNQLSVLQNFKPENLKTNPFPYIYIPEVLPWDLYERLEAEYPEQHCTKGETHGFGTMRYMQHEFDYENVVTPLWRDFAAYHTSKEYKDELIRAFRVPMTDLYPKGRFAEDLYTKYIRSDVSPRRAPVGSTVRMELQFVMNAIDHKHIRTPHVDQSKELFACLFYFKKPEDKGEDGGLNIYRNTAGKQWRRVTGREAVPEDIKAVDHIPYKRNTMVCFLNSVDSLHGVTPRNNPSHIRRYVNIDGHIVEKLFAFQD
jgi:hypothetical protein|tara:strand:- start:481 stop:1251 length:771 start_codon:yes stop_codon:yes gene_type:complete